jgi:hypothetical protein
MTSLGPGRELTYKIELAGHLSIKVFFICSNPSIIIKVCIMNPTNVIVHVTMHNKMRMFVFAFGFTCLYALTGSEGVGLSYIYYALLDVFSM